jgi:AcrR family transcriptional regulator
MEYDPGMDPEVDLDSSRRARKKRRTRREIYEAAMALFAESDFDSVTISSICERADVGRGTFFLHFPTKSALLFEFSQRVAEEFSAGLSEPRDSARAELEALVRRIAAAFSAQPEVMLGMLREFSTSREALAFGAVHGWAFPDLIAAIVERGQKRGEFRANIDPRLAAAALLSTSGAILSGFVFRDDQPTPEATLEQLFALLFNGLVPAGEADVALCGASGSGGSGRT